MPDESPWQEPLWQGPLSRCPKCGRGFASRKRWLDGHVILARRLEHARFRKIETFSPKNHVHTFRLVHPNDVDGTFAAWMREAYAVGEQRHIH
jgi:hypothetical protein